MSKGSRDRTSNRVAYEFNYEAIFDVKETTSLHKFANNLGFSFEGGCWHSDSGFITEYQMKEMYFELNRN